MSHHSYQGFPAVWPTGGGTDLRAEFASVQALCSQGHRKSDRKPACWRAYDPAIQVLPLGSRR